ncbi:MAG: TIGR00282 family metallophosphoesterase [Alphaproteobacteria bacterium]|nr:MAG: TIGR00282 family metallophosphoesterase [Alphaproteobacteria bacterium]
MRILFFGDVVGRSGRDALIEHLPRIHDRFTPDCVIVNAENAAAGFGVTKSICEDLYAAGVHVITTGNHVWDNTDILNAFQSFKGLLRPANFPQSSPGSGWTLYPIPIGKNQGKHILVINLMGRLFMDPLNDPFEIMEEILQKYSLSSPSTDAIFVDFHGEATSEKQAFAAYFDGKISGVIGTHTHVPTADTRILPQGTAFQTDAGMCGDYQSVIGMELSTSFPKFLKRGPSKRMQVSSGEGTLFGVCIDVDDQTGKAIAVERLQYGKSL